jgi:hypothetical protein
VSARPIVTVRVHGPAPARERWYRSLAYALAATAGGSAVFESSGAEPLPWVTVRPKSVVEAMPGTSLAGAPTLELASGPPDREPPRGWPQFVRPLVAPFPRAPGGAYRTAIARGPPERFRAPTSEPWIEVQTHWVRGRAGDLWIARRFRVAASTGDRPEDSIDRVGAALAGEWSFVTGTSSTVGVARRGAIRDWRRGHVRAVPPEGWWRRAPDSLSGAAETRCFERNDPALGAGTHAVVFGASGTGKTTFLAELAAREIGSGARVVAIDLHGDLAPGVAARLPDEARPIAIDPTDPPAPGISALATDAPGADAAAAHLVAALKRLTPDGQDLYWGFRLERLFDSFVRLVQETGGSLVDLYDLLTDPARRDAARLATRREDLARFLDELAPIVRRQPEFLWSATARLSKVVLVPALAELLAPREGGIPIESQIEAGRSLLVRLPFATLGPEAAAFAGSLLLARIYLGLAARRRPDAAETPVLFVLDEAHTFSPRLVAELLTESRKFGIRVVLATQFPDRLAPEVRAAAAGSPSEYVTFRLPPTSAAVVGTWVGLSRDDAQRWLPTLPVGHAVRLDSEGGTARPLTVERPVERPDAWPTALQRTRREFASPDEPAEAAAPEGAIERLLLAVLAGEEEGRPIDPGHAVVAALTLPGPPLPPENLGDRWGELVRQRLVTVTDDGCRLTAAGARRVGLTATTGAPRESSEHRALLLASFRLFARRGYRLEILRQGRFDTTLPDAILHQLSRRTGMSPVDLGAEIDRVRGGWAWRFFGGRDVHVEVEVSGALRAERIRRGWAKARARGAFALFVVGDADRARRVRAALRRLELRPDRAQVWTLRLPGEPDASPVGSPPPKG